MKINEIQRKEKVENVAVLGCDVSSERIDCYSEVSGMSVEIQIKNDTVDIEKNLDEFGRFVHDQGYENVLVVAEPSGPYGELMFRIALQKGMNTAWVSGEAVKKTREIENNSHSKTDPIDCRAIYSLGFRGKTLAHRQFGAPYEALREWNGIYEVADKGVVRARNETVDQLKRMFPDYSFKKDFLFGNSGRALVELYGANPYNIVSVGKSRFFTRMKNHVKGIRRDTLQRLYNQAIASAATAKRQTTADILETRLRQHYEDFLVHHKRKMDARKAMCELYEKLRQFDAKLPAEIPRVVTTFYLARIVAETGPLSDFQTVKQLFKYAGLDLQVRQSGKFKGKTKLSKRGRTALRKVLTFAVLPLVKKNGLYGKMYHSIKDKREMPGAKAMTIIAKKFLKMIFGIYRSGAEYDASRVFECHSQHKKAA